jgi:hypothetical protein
VVLYLSFRLELQHRDLKLSTINADTDFLWRSDMRINCDHFMPWLNMTTRGMKRKILAKKAVRANDIHHLYMTGFLLDVIPPLDQ